MSDEVDRLEQARSELSTLDGRPVEEHVDVLDRVNRTIAAELAALDEV